MEMSRRGKGWSVLVPGRKVVPKSLWSVSSAEARPLPGLPRQDLPGPDYLPSTPTAMYPLLKNFLAACPSVPTRTGRREGGANSASVAPGFTRLKEDFSPWHLAGSLGAASVCCGLPDQDGDLPLQVPLDSCMIGDHGDLWRPPSVPFPRRRLESAAALPAAWSFVDRPTVLARGGAAGGDSGSAGTLEGGRLGVPSLLGGQGRGEPAPPPLALGARQAVESTLWALAMRPPGDRSPVSWSRRRLESDADFHAAWPASSALEPPRHPWEARFQPCSAPSSSEAMPRGGCSFAPRRPRFGENGSLLPGAWRCDGLSVVPQRRGAPR